MEEQEIYTLITRYLAKKTTTEESERIADWIAESAESEQTFEDIKQVWHATKSQLTSDSSVPLRKLKNRIAQANAKPGEKFKKLRVKWVAVAASVILFAVMGSLTKQWYLRTLNQRLTVSTSAGQQRKVLLEDGTTVYLAPQSTLTYPGHFDVKRTVELHGQAYFEVSKNKHRPFIVHTAKLDVQVLGTHFNVNSYPNQSSTTVSLLEGKVKVSVPDNGIDEYMLSPGQELALHHASHQVYRYALDSAAVAGWMSNTLVFRNEKLAVAAKKIEQMYGVKIVFADQATAETNIYAKFKNEPLTSVLATIAVSGNITHHTEGNKIYLSLKKSKTLR